METPFDNGSASPTSEGKAGVKSTEVNPPAAVQIAAQTKRVPQAKTKYTAKITEYGKNLTVQHFTRLHVVA